MLFKFIFNIAFLLMLGMLMYYTFLYTQISEDITTMRDKLQKCYKTFVPEVEEETEKYTSTRKNKKKNKK